jgi:hypothetical protein
MEFLKEQAAIIIMVGLMEDDRGSRWERGQDTIIRQARQWAIFLLLPVSLPLSLGYS